ITIHGYVSQKLSLLARKTKTSLRKSKAKPKEMAKNLSSVTFTVLLLVLLMASTGYEHQGQMPSTGMQKCYILRCGPEPFTGSNNDCCHCCVAKYGREAVCKGVVEGPDKHCHCYKERHYMCVCVCSTLFCFQIKHQGQSISMLSPKCKLMLCEFFASF
ncbi:LOW QUALITY PROTEIN: hypothetical protein HID58_085843, partial [Brassica napus]